MRHAALLLLGALAACAQTARPEETSSVQGRVLNAVTREPVGKASLLLMRTDSSGAGYDWTLSYSASTDSAGKYEVRNIGPGKYRLRASRNGFVTLEYGARPSTRSGAVLDLDSPQQLKDIDLRLTPHGVIAGRILDADGEPLAGAQVQLLRAQYVNGKKVLATTTNAYTNDLGEYRCAGLTPGRYYIYARNFGGLPPTTVVKEDYVPVYYPGAADATGAVPIDVTAGAQVRAADMMLHKAKTATVRGRVAVEAPGAGGSPSVNLFPSVGHDQTAASTSRVYQARVNAAGTFEVRGLTPGSYAVLASVSRGGRGYTGRTTVNVSGADIEDLVVTIGTGVSMTGRVRVDGEATLDLRNPHIILQPGGPGVASRPSSWQYKVAEDRTFRIDDLRPDRYGILAGGLPDGFYTKSVRAGDAEVTYSGVDLTFGAPGQVDILVSPRAGLVSGVAQNPDSSQPAQGATVVLTPTEKERVAVFALYQQTTTDQHGRFTIKNVVPGEYKVYAWEDVEPTAWMDPDFMKPLASRGESVTVVESAQVVVQVKVILAEPEGGPPESAKGALRP